MRRKWVKPALWLTLGGTASMVLLAAVLLYTPFVIREVKNPVAGLFNDTLLRTVPPDFASYRLRGETFTFRTRDSLVMSAYRVPAEGRVKGTVIALHGYRSNKNKYLPVIKYFTEAGYDFVAPDLRGHNMSEGQFTGFSYREKNDIEDLLAYLKKKGWLRGKLVLYGHSIGAATAVEVAARHGADALVTESLFTSFDEILPHYLTYYTGVPADSLPEEAEKFFYRQMEIPPDSIRPIDRIGRVNCPVLLVHGTEDKKVPPSHARRLKDTLGDRGRLMLIPGATHNTLWEKGGEVYFRRLIRFLDSASAY
ncbi:MAG: alpha/beta hydrolase [Chlorobi bacterium]|nr:alpha/beta hydrolase [Chlorobiota bacterium]